MKWSCELIGQDSIEVSSASNSPKYSDVKVIGCSQLLDLFRSLKSKFGEDLSKWEAPAGNSHSEILMRELLSKLTGQWKLPYSHDELCHCRKVATTLVDQAVIRGAHTVPQINRQTQAGTACGTCTADIESLIRYRTR